MTDHFISTPTQPARCRCGVPTLTALCEGVKVRVDEEPVDDVAGGQMGRLVGELDVLLRGGRTYVRRVNGELLERDEGRIRGGSVAGTIHAEHVCPAQLVAVRRAA